VVITSGFIDTICLIINLMPQRMALMRIGFLGLVAGSLLLAGCNRPEALLPTISPVTPQLTPYHTLTAIFTPTPPNPDTPTPLPPPTRTPRTHTVQAGQDMGGIAAQYGVTVQALMAANPQVDPGAMPVGTVLIIPELQNAQGTPLIPDSAPTALSAVLGPVNCTPTREGGAWCFLVVYNNQAQALESVSAAISAVSASGDWSATRVATALLNQIPAGGMLPLAAYFPPPVAFPMQTSARLTSALPVVSTDQRYLPVRLENLRTEIAPNGLTAELSGDILLDGDVAAGQVWVAAAAYDANGNVVGVRRWENNAPLAGKSSQPFVLRVYSVGEKIFRVEAMVEARP